MCENRGELASTAGAGVLSTGGSGGDAGASADTAGTGGGADAGGVTGGGLPAERATWRTGPGVAAAVGCGGAQHVYDAVPVGIGGPQVG